MTDEQGTATAGDGADGAATDYDCKLCGWQFTTINGLWDHIPSHQLTQSQYAVLTQDWPDLQAAHAECSNLSHAEASRIFEEAREMRDERDDLTARLAELREAGDMMATAMDLFWIGERPDFARAAELMGEASARWRTLAATATERQGAPGARGGGEDQP